MSVRNDGSVKSSNVHTLKSFYKKGYQNNPNIHRGVVTRVLYSDDILNVTHKTENPVVLYDVMVLSGELAGHLFTNVRKIETLGGSLNYSEQILRAIAENTEFSGIGGKRIKEVDGDIVVIGFLSGEKRSPIILGCEKSNKNTGSSAKKEDGPRQIEEYNGVKTEINKDGEYKITQKGGTYNAQEGYFEPNTNPAEYLANLELKGETLTLTFKSGLKVFFDGASNLTTFETSGGSKMEIKDDGITLEVGNNKIVLDQDKIDLNAAMVNIGQSAAFSAVLFENLQSAFNAHTHNCPQAPAGVLPSTPPMVPLLPSVGSTSVKIKN